MKILFVSHEVSPFAKVGGLADVAGSLPKALKKLGHDVRVAMPAYKMVRQDKRWGAKPIVGNFEVAMNPRWNETASAESIHLNGLDFYLLKVGDHFDNGTSSDTVYQPGEEQHIAFAKAALELCRKLGWAPDVIHTNDWHTGLIPVYLKEGAYKDLSNTASVHSIHNLAYQGTFPAESMSKTGLPPELFDMYHLEAYGKLNFLKAACVYADRVNTVSPTYSHEIQTTEYGCMLEGVMRHLAEEGRLYGILNGIDRAAFDPSKDDRIEAHYDWGKLAGKGVCRKALHAELKWHDEQEVPLAGMITRISSQKGFDLLLAAGERIASLPMRVVILGQGDPALCEQLEEIAKRFPRRVRYIRKFDLDLAQRIYAGADMFLMPSSFEPCGLGQLFAMRYGAIPVVRKTGGLADTVQDGETGFVFEERSVDALLEACSRAAASFADPATWQTIVRAAMARDFGWEASAKKYEALYHEAIAAKTGRLQAQAA